jgi:2-C-methyl-D-erythritol 4-phosphate cytidylyltransferase
MQSNLFKVIIVAGGVGKRVGKDVPKQFLPINNHPILIHTLKKFLPIFSPEHIVLCIKNEQVPKLYQILSEFQIQGIQITNGGEHRTDSVRNGLQYIHQICPNYEGFVLIHDAVRPFVSTSFLQEFTNTLQEKKALVTVCPIKNSIRKKEGDFSYAVNREDYWEVQTPQGFLFSEIYEAYAHTNQLFSDDASLYENYFKKPVSIIEYIPENIKITTVIDLILADYLAKNGY